MKKLLALLCALTLLLGAVPFAGVAEEEPTEIIYMRGQLNRSAVSYYEDTLWVQELMKNLNINLRIDGPANSSDYNTSVNTMLVSGDYPDLLYYGFDRNYDGGAMAAIEDGVIVPVSENAEYKAAAQNWFDIVDSNEYIRRSVTQDDGVISMFCHYETNINRGAYWGYAIRKDWLDRLGLEIPTTVDELEAVLVAFKEQDANGNGDPNDELPMSDLNWSNTTRPGVNSIAAAWTLKVNTMYRDPHTGEATYWTEYNDGANFKDYVLTMRDWYARGLLDPEYISHSSDAAAAKIMKDQVGFFFCFPDNVKQYKEGLRVTLEDGGYADPNGAIVYGMVPVTGEDGIAYNYDSDNSLVGWAGASQPTYVTTGAEKRGTVMKALEFLNYCYSEEGSDICNWGVEGVSYTKDAEGNKHWTELVSNDPDYSMGDAVFKYAMPTLGSWPKAMSYEAWGEMNLVEDDAKVMHANYATGNIDLDMPSISLNSDELEDYRLLTDINTAVSEVYVQVITGAKPAEALDDLLNQVKGMGIEDVVAAYNSAYARYLAK